MTDPADLSIPEAAAALREGRLTARALTEAALARIAARNDRLHAFTYVNPGALAEADRADALLSQGDAGIFCGIPVAVKDMIDVAGQPCDLRFRCAGGPYCRQRRRSGGPPPGAGRGFSWQARNV